MINKIIAFGDSVTHGAELPELELGDLSKHMHNIFGTTSLTPKLRGEWKYVKQWYDLLDTIPDYKEKCNQLSYCGQLGNALDIPVTNFGRPGNSNNATLNAIINNLDLIDENTLVIVGLASVYRTSRFLEYYVQCYNTSVTKTKEHAKWVELGLDWDDDPLSKLSFLMQFILSVPKILPTQHVIFIDPYSIYITNKLLQRNMVTEWIQNSGFDENLWHKTHIEFIQRVFDENIFTSTFAEFMETQNDIEYKRCVLNHPSKDLHSILAKEYLLPYIKEQNWI
jgi:hypothetical protein